MDQDALDSAVGRAQAEADKMAGLGISREKICQMLSMRHSAEVVRRIFPDLPIPESNPSTHRRLLEVPRGRRLTPAAEAPAKALVPPSAAVPIRQTDRPVVFAPDKLAFHYVPFIQCSLPHSEPGAVSQYSRQNGRLTVTLAVTRPGVGLPCGIPARLLAIHIATEVVRTKSREILLGRSIGELLRKLDVRPTTGRQGAVQAYLGQLRRLVYTIVTIEESVEDGVGRQGLHIRNVPFIEEALLWDDVPYRRGSSLLLSEPIFESMLERSAPLSIEAIRALRRSPLDLDLYAWLVYRLYSLRRKVIVPWSDLSLQFGHSYTRERDFRDAFKASLQRVHNVYPMARVEVGPSGLTLNPSTAHIARAHRPA